MEEKDEIFKIYYNIHQQFKDSLLSYTNLAIATISNRHCNKSSMSEIKETINNITNNMVENDQRVADFKEK